MKKSKSTSLKSLDEESPGDFEDIDLDTSEIEPLEEPSSENVSIEEMRIRKLQEKKENELLSIGEEVTGVGVGLDKYNKPMLTVYVKTKSKSLIKKIQAVLEGEPVIIEESGEIIAQ